MTDKEKQELDSTASEQEESIKDESMEQPTSSTADSSEKPSKAPMFIALLALIIAVGGLGVGYQKWVELKSGMQQGNQAVASVRDKQNEIKGRLDESGKTIAAQQSAFNAQDEMLKQERAKLAQQATEMKESLDGVFQRIGRSSTQWIVAEAEYLMRIANHRLQLEGDAATAMVALESADARLHDSGDPTWTGVREKLAAEIAELKAIKAMDLAGNVLKLSGLVSQVEKLKLPQSGPVISARSEDSGDKAKEFNFDTVLKDGWEGFKTLMVIRRNDRPLTAMLGPEQRFFLYQNLRLQLEAARLALLRKDQALFDSSLQRASAWVGEFFDPKQATTKSMQAGIAELQGLEVQTKLPNISGSLRTLLEQRKLNAEEQKAGS